MPPDFDAPQFWRSSLKPLLDSDHAANDAVQSTKLTRRELMVAKYTVSQ